MVTNVKRVSFDDLNLVEVHVFPDCEENVLIRKTYWEIFARDRYRFKDRISLTEADLKDVFGWDHRQRIYSERFHHPAPT